MKRPRITIANWKMNLNVRRSVSHAQQIRAHVTDKRVKGEIVICPSFPNLVPVKEALKRSKIKLGAQNMFYHDKGAYTGEVSPTQIKATGAKYVLIGHSERRVYFKETDLDVNKKVLAAVQYGLTPVICVGEKLEERRLKRTAEVVRRQIKMALSGVDPRDVIIAYEPIWAISTFQKTKKKTPATVTEIATVHSFIRRVIAKISTQQIADAIPILYGGSVNAKNAKEFGSVEDIDGMLVGSASLKPLEFIRICQACTKS